ncbi:hypothetical protein KM295_02350 [Natronomonas sp. F2-12]|uniref:Coiled-coil protein n=1 Tax=Natronomonas aquatica TaxID=2841590 RepID=A0A9R1CRE4_9EURY|nr:hypothetical protein [Natronomonas aquatica]MCQ4332346.1 hypothetical protein [Natronomonas aquatica]
MAAAASGAIVFVLTGMSEVVWATMIGIPIVVVAGIALYVRGLITRSKTSEQQYVRKRGRSVAETFQDYLRTLNDLRDAYPNWSQSVDARVDSLVADFGTQGIRFEPRSGSFELTGSVDSADVQEFERLETEIESFHDEFEELFREFAREETDEIESQTARLEDVDLVRSAPSVSLPPATDPIPAYRDTLDEAREEADEAIEAAIETVREMTRGDMRPDDIDAIEAELESASGAADNHDYYAATESILEARDRLRDQLSGSFEAERDRLSDLLDAVLRSNVDEHVDAEYVDEITKMRDEVESLDSALELAELTRKQAQLRRTCVTMIRSMERDLDDAVRTLQSAELPGGYYDEPPVVEESLAETLEDIDDFERFTAEWADAAARLTDALETARTKASVVEAYDDFAGQIDTRLQEAGEVTADDLPVRHAEQFLGLYNRRNPSIEFDPAQGVLRRGDVERHDVTVDLQYERGGELRQATVELDGGVHSERETVETRVAASVEFDEVPAGTYTLSGDPGDEAFGSVERELEVDGDTTTAVEFAERSLRERLCSDFDQDMGEHVPAIDSQVSSTFEEQGYVSTGMELPVRDSYVPCLIAIWSERNGYDLVESDEEVIVYDRSQVERELKNTVRYNIEAGDELRFEEAKKNFLSVPLPDATIREMVAGLETGEDVTTTATAIKIE